VDLQLEKTVTRKTFWTWSDYSLYSGVTLKGWPVMTMIRGRLVMRDGVVTAAPGYGRFVPRHATRR
jgi:dihydropyrimidinase